MGGRFRASGAREAPGPLAQLAEQGTLNPKVGGSIPPRPTARPGVRLRRLSIPGTMRAMRWLGACVLALALGVSAALADPGALVKLGQRTASGRKAHAVVVVPNIPAHRYEKVTLEVDAKPRQKVRADYIGSCARDGIGGSRPSGQKTGRTPL